MIQVNNGKRRKVYTNWEWTLIWVSWFIIGMLAGATALSLYSKIKEASSKKDPQETVVPSVAPETIPADTSNFTAEKHFDCIVEEILSSNEGTMYITECGVPFYSKHLYHKGDTLKNFNSPKHK